MATLEYAREQERTTISGVLAKELDGIASIHAPELSAAIPGFAWPDAEHAQLPADRPGRAALQLARRSAQ